MVLRLSTHPFIPVQKFPVAAIAATPMAMVRQGKRPGRVNMSDNFNYIAFGNPDYVEGKIKTIGMNRARMFEYTPTDIEERLGDLDASAVAFLEKLPTFLCSEVMRKGRGEGVSMLVKYGRIDETDAGRREVSTRFETLIDFGEIDFADLDEARDLFGADAYQLFRTHWAVRAGDAQAILAELAELKPGLKPDLAKLVAQEVEPGAAAPPPRIRETLGVAGSVEAFLQLLYKLSGDGRADGEPSSGEETESFFRGHEDARFELTPSLLRKSADGAWQFMPNEDRLCKELLIAHYDEFQADQYRFDRLVRMQHYGLPTRLLDISSNPLVALFFACHGRDGPSDVDGEVIVFRVRSDDVKYYDSDTVSCLANISNLTFEQKNDMDLNLTMEAFNETEVAGKLLHHIKSEKGFFEPRMVPDDLRSIVCVKAKRTNTRIKSQAGAFLLYGHDATLSEDGQEGMAISRITITDKAHILRQLDSINVNATTVYPSIDQTTVHLRERYRGGRCT